MRLLVREDNYMIDEVVDLKIGIIVLSQEEYIVGTIKNYI